MGPVAVCCLPKACHMHMAAFPLSNLFIQKYDLWSDFQTACGPQTEQLAG